MKRLADPVAEDARSALFLAKATSTQLSKAAKSHKQQSKLKFHQFQYIHTARDLTLKSKQAEEDLRTWIGDKAAAEGWTEPGKMLAELGLGMEREQRSVWYQVNGARELVDSVVRLKSAGETSPILTSKVAEVAAHLDEVKDFLSSAHLKAQATALEAEIRSFNISDSDPKPDFTVSFPSGSVPGYFVDRLDEGQIRAEYERACSLVDALFDTQLSALKDKEVANPWPEDAASRFEHIHRTYVKEGKPRERYFERLLLEFPSLTREDLDAQDRVVEALRWAKNSRKNLQLDWERHRKALQASADAMLSAEIAKLQEKANRDAEFLEQEQKLVRINQEYAARNAEFQAKLAVQSEAQRAKEALDQAEAEMKDRARLEYERKRKETAAVYQQRKAKELEQLKSAQLTQEARAAERKKAEIERNRGKVQAKRESEMRKIKQNLDQRAQRQEAAASSKVRIDTAIAAYSHIPKVDLDRARVQQPTQSKLAKKVLRDPTDAAVLYKQTGFTAESLMKDMRYRLSAALTEAGLAGTEYGKRVIREAPPAMKPRSDMLSTYQHL